MLPIEKLLVERKCIGLDWGELQLADLCICYRSTPLRILTKGDNNAADDTELYARGQDFLNRKEDVIGSVVGFVPFIGYVTILLSEYPWLKQAMLGLMGLMVVLQRE
jgi:signal peptidase